MQTQAVPIPWDDKLTGLQLLFDVNAVRQRLNSAGYEVEDGRVSYVRYKPGTNCIAAYEFAHTDSLTVNERVVYFYGKCFTKPDFELALDKARNHRWADARLLSPATPFGNRNTLFHAFPYDTRLDALRLLEEPRKLTRFIQRLAPEFHPDEWRISDAALVNDIMRYKPERRAVLRSSTKAINRRTGERRQLKLYWRVYCNGSAPESFRRMDFLASNLPQSREIRTPKPLGFDSEAQLVLMGELTGRPLEERLQTDDVHAVERTAVALAKLHALADERLPRRYAGDYLLKAMETKRMLASLSTDLGDQAHRICERLRRNLPEPASRPVLVHGDFYYGQVLVGRDGLGIVDFDRLHMGTPLADLGNFIAHLKLLQLENRLQNPNTFASSFIRAYGDRFGTEPPPNDLRWWTALSLLMLAVGPFRRLEPEWPRMVSSILDATSRALC